MPTGNGCCYVNGPASELADICPSHRQPSDQGKPHAVVVPWPGQGHITPLLHLSQKLVDRGFSVTFVNSDYTHARVVSSIRRQLEEEGEKLVGSDDEANGDQQLSVPPPLPGVAYYASRKLGIHFVGIPDGVPKEHTRTNNVEELCRGMIRSAPGFEQLLRDLQPPPTCIISDTFVLHTQDAANKLGIPRISFWTQSAASYAAHLAASRGLIELPLEPNEKCITTIPGAPPLRLKDLPSFLQCLDRSDFLFCISTDPFLRTNEAACVLMNTFNELEKRAMEALRQQQAECTFYVIGPVLPSDYFSMMKAHSFKNKAAGLWEADYGCLQWLNKQEEGSVLYVSFGSTTELSEQELEELALGLEATGCPVLWVLRPDLMREGGGELGLPTGFARRTEGHILIIKWAPQLQVLAHTAIGGFFTHGGWNSTLESMAQGKPMLGFPYFADQMLNCRCMEEEWGNGLALEQHGEAVITRSLVERKARAIMQPDGKLRDTALKLRDAAWRAVLSTDQQGSSTADLNRFFENLDKLQNLQ